MEEDDNSAALAHQQELEHQYFEVVMSGEKNKFDSIVSEHEALTVGELIEVLQKLPANAEVVVSNFGEHSEAGALIEYAISKNIVEINRIIYY